MKHNVNVIAVLSPDGDKVLLCKRKKPPYLGLYNFVGGKIEPGEDGLTAAYRELQEETGIPRDAIDLIHLMSFTYPLEDCLLEAYAGRLKDPVEVRAEKNPLVWMDIGQDYADGSKFAGKGNMGHILYYYTRNPGNID